MSERKTPCAATTLLLTGERTVPGIPHENYWFRRHEAVYRYLVPRIAGLIVLEVGCGEGYGTALLSTSSRSTTGVDYDDAAIKHAARKYRAARFLRANLAALPIRNATVDALVTLQVIEHVWDHGQFLRECRRVLRPDGSLIVSTPNRLTFSPGRATPLNPFHTHEFIASELVGLLTTCGFVVDAKFGLHPSRRLRSLDERWSGSFVDAQLAAPPEAWPSSLLTDVASVTTGDFVLADAETADIDSSLDLVVIAHA